MQRLTMALAALGLAALLAGDALANDAAKALSPAASATEMPAAKLPEPDTNTPVVSSTEDYRIGPFDIIDVSVFQVEMLSKTLQVDAAGNIQYPMLGEVAASGKTARQLAAEIADRLDKSYLRNPQVTVYVKDSASEKFTVEGAVKESGIYPLAGHMTLLRAIATAKGVDPDAKQRNVIIFRTVNQKRVAGLINLGDVRNGKVDDPQVYAGDVIVVPMSGTRKAYKDLLSAVPLLLFLHP